MRVLSVVYDLDIGGTQRAAVDFANAYHALGHESALLALDDSGSRRKDLLPQVSLVSTSQVLDAGISPQPDLIHIHGHGVSYDLVRELRERYPDSLLVEQNVFAKVNPWNAFLDRTFLFSDWCLSQYEREPNRKAATALVPNPIEPANFFPDALSRQQFRHRLGIPEGAFVVGRVGQPLIGKWSVTLLRAFESLLAENTDAWLLLVGPPREILEAVESSIAKARTVVVERVEEDSELRGLYNAMDLLGHVASQGETFGYVLVEAALCGVPAITLSTPWADNSQGEIVGHEVGGLVATTTRGFVRAMRKMANQPELRHRYGTSARESALARFDSVTVAKSALDVVAIRKEEPAPASQELIREYRRAIDPAGVFRGLLFRARLFDVLAVVSGENNFAWWVRRTLNKRGISRHMLKSAKGR